MRARLAMTGVAAAICVAVFACPAAADPMPRAASVSVCTDQYLLALAEPQQVAAVSWQATTVRSPVRDRAAGLPQLRGTAEELLTARVDLVVFDPYGLQAVAALLPQHDIRIHRVGDVVRLEDIEQEIQRLGVALERGAAARDLAGALQSRRLAFEAASSDTGPRALYVAPGGSGTGSGTYIDDAMRLAGFRNLQADLGYIGWQRIPLEELVAQPPDVLILSLFSTSDPSLLDSFARHPRFRALVASVPVIEVPAAPWVCAGPYVLDAVAYLSQERERLFPGSGRVARYDP